MTEFTGDLRDANFVDADLTGVRFRECDLTRVVVRGADLSEAVIDGARIRGLLIDGIEVAPLIEAELNRQEHARALRHASSPVDLREAWAAIEQAWDAACGRVVAMPAGTTEVSVDEEWSFSQTLRHLVFATDVWLGPVLGADPRFHPLGLPFTNFEKYVGPGVDFGLDLAATPSYDDVLGVRADRVSRVREFINSVTEKQLGEELDGPPWADRRVSVQHSLSTILNEECEHLRFAKRDLEAISQRA